LSEKNHLEIYVEYGDIISLRNHSQIEDFKEAIDQYFGQYISPTGMKKSPKKNLMQSDKKIPAYFYLVIIPERAR
jgi:hypothetical protein